jgi:hypothetical protein
VRPFARAVAGCWEIADGPGIQIVALGADCFEDTSVIHDDDERNDVAMIFAGLVDVTRKFHVQAPWPFHVQAPWPFHEA